MENASGPEWFGFITAAPFRGATTDRVGASSRLLTPASGCAGGPGTRSLRTCRRNLSPLTPAGLGAAALPRSEDVGNFSHVVPVAANQYFQKDLEAHGSQIRVRDDTPVDGEEATEWIAYPPDSREDATDSHARDLRHQTAVRTGETGEIRVSREPDPTAMEYAPDSTGDASVGTISGGCWRSPSMTTITPPSAAENPSATAPARPPRRSPATRWTRRIRGYWRQRAVIRSGVSSSSRRRTRAPMSNPASPCSRRDAGSTPVRWRPRFEWAQSRRLRSGRRSVLVHHHSSTPRPPPHRSKDRCPAELSRLHVSRRVGTGCSPIARSARGMYRRVSQSG